MNIFARGALQIIGGVLLVLPKTKMIGAAVVAITFLISAVVLGMSGNIPVTIVTVICIALLALVVRQSGKNAEF